MYIQFESFLSLLVGFIGIFIIILMFFSYKSNVNVNIYIIIVLAFASFRFITYGLVHLDFFELHPNFHTYFIPISLIAIPSFLLYLRALLMDYRSFYKRDLLHFIFPLLSLTLNFLQTKFEVFQNHTIELTQIWCVVLFFMLYMVFIVLELKKIIAKIFKPKNKGNTEHQWVVSRWIIFIITIAIISGLKLVLSVVYEYRSGDIITGNSFFIINILIWGLKFGFILFNIEILYGFPNLKTDVKIDSNLFLYKDSTWILDNKHLESQHNEIVQPTVDKKNLAYIHNIEKFVTTQSPFRVSEYKAKDLAKDLNVPSSHIAYLFKYYSKINFTEFKNTKRIKDAIFLIDQDFLVDKTFDALATQVGFTSYNPFFVAFKKQTNLSPAQYLQSLGAKT